MSSTSHSTTRRAALGKPLSGVYLIHFHTPYGHARHYLGWSSNIPSRIAKHIAGEGARLTQVATEAGIVMGCVRIWPFAPKSLERRLKGHHRASLCPTCNSAGWQSTCKGELSVGAGFHQETTQDVNFYA